MDRQRLHQLVKELNEELNNRTSAENLRNLLKELNGFYRQMDEESE